MELIELKTTIRTKKGNGPARALRRSGRIPAVFYGPQTDPILLSVDIKDLEQIFQNNTIGQVIFNLNIQNGDTIVKSAMIKELQVHPLSQDYLHADFYEVAMDRKIRVKVPVSTKGKSIGVEHGGTLQIIRRELEILCLPLEIPDRVELDITDLEIGDSLHVEDISLGDNIELPPDVNFTILTIGSPKLEIEEEVEEEELTEEEIAAAEEAAAEEESSETEEN